MQGLEGGRGPPLPPLILGVIGRDVMEYLTGEPEKRLMVTVIHITARMVAALSTPTTGMGQHIRHLGQDFLRHTMTTRVVAGKSTPRIVCCSSHTNCHNNGLMHFRATERIPIL